MCLTGFGGLGCDFTGVGLGRAGEVLAVRVLWVRG